MPEEVPPAEYEDIVMLEQHRHLANKCKDSVNLQGAEALCRHAHSLFVYKLLFGFTALSAEIILTCLFVLQLGVIRTNCFNSLFY